MSTSLLAAAPGRQTPPLRARLANGPMAGVAALALVGSLFAALSSAAFAFTPNTAGPPTTTHSVQPTYNSGNITSCPSGTTSFINTSSGGSGFQSVSYSNGGTFFDATVDSTHTYISFTTNSPGFTVYVKGGPAYDTYDYTVTAYPSDAGLHGPINNGGNIPTISHYLVCGSPFVAVTPTQATTTSGTSVASGTAVFDTDTVSGAFGAANTGGATDDVSFALYGPFTTAPNSTSCTGQTPVYTSGTKAFTGGTASTPGQTWTATSGNHTLTNSTASAVYYTWVATASFTDPANNDPTPNPTACGDTSETLQVAAAAAPPPAKASPTQATTASGGGTLGTLAAAISDTDTASGAFGTANTGGATDDVSFALYGPFTTAPTSTSCTGQTPVYTSGTKAFTGGTAATAGQTWTAGSGTFTPTAAGFYTWVATATFTDANNNTPTPNPTTCGDVSETVQVTAVSPTQATTAAGGGTLAGATPASISDTDTVSGAFGAANTGGATDDVSFVLYGPFIAAPTSTSCTGRAPVFSSGTKAFTGGTANTAGQTWTASSGTYSTTATGFYTWVATASFTDPNNSTPTPNSTACGDSSETVQVRAAAVGGGGGGSPASPTQATTASGGGTLGTSGAAISDTDTVSGANGKANTGGATDDVSFALYGPFTSAPASTSCAGQTPVYTSGTVALSGGTPNTTGQTWTAGSGSFTPTAAGFYTWVATATFTDANNNTPTPNPTTCGDASETVHVTAPLVTPPPTTSTQTPPSTTSGQSPPPVIAQNTPLLTSSPPPSTPGTQAHGTQTQSPVSGATTVHTGEPWAGSRLLELLAGLAGLAMIGWGLRRRRQYGMHDAGS